MRTAKLRGNIRLTGRQVMALEYVRRSSYVHPRTKDVLNAKGLTKPGYAGLTDLGALVYTEAWARHLLGGRIELNRIYRF